jgi:hypothetical protein
MPLAVCRLRAPRGARISCRSHESADDSTGAGARVPHDRSVGGVERPHDARLRATRARTERRARSLHRERAARQCTARHRRPRRLCPNSAPAPAAPFAAQGARQEVFMRGLPRGRTFWPTTSSWRQPRPFRQGVTSMGAWPNCGGCGRGKGCSFGGGSARCGADGARRLPQTTVARPLPPAVTAAVGLGLTSKSGPSVAGQLSLTRGLSDRQAAFHASGPSTGVAHLTAPVSMSRATIWGAVGLGLGRGGAGGGAVADEGCG